MRPRASRSPRRCEISLTPEGLAHVRSIGATVGLWASDPSWYEPPSDARQLATRTATNRRRLGRRRTGCISVGVSCSTSRERRGLKLRCDESLACTSVSGFECGPAHLESSYKRGRSYTRGNAREKTQFQRSRAITLTLTACCGRGLEREQLCSLLVKRSRRMHDPAGRPGRAAHSE